MTSSPPLEQKPETYVPKMKPGDVEIPNRVFVKGFSKDASVDDLFAFFEQYGKVLECRIVADRYGCSKGFGFVTFDSQNVAETVKELERIKYSDDIELVIGPARIRKKRFYLLPAQSYSPPQPFYAPDGSIVWATPMPQNVPQQAQMVSSVPMTQQQTNYGSPVILSVVNEPPQYKQQQCITYQPASPQGMNVINVGEQKVAIQSNIGSPVCVDDTQQVPCMSPVSSGYIDMQPTYNITDGVVYNPMVPMMQKMSSMRLQ